MVSWDSITPDLANSWFLLCVLYVRERSIRVVLTMTRACGRIQEAEIIRYRLNVTYNIYSGRAKSEGLIDLYSRKAFIHSPNNYGLWWRIELQNMYTRSSYPGVFVSREKSLILVARPNPLASSPFLFMCTPVELVLSNGTPEDEISTQGFPGPCPII